MADKNTPKRKRPKSPANLEQYRKPAKMVRVRSHLSEIGEQAAASLAQDFTQFVNDSIRIRLEGMGLWPPPKPKP